MLPEERLDNILINKSPTNFPYAKAFEDYTLNDDEVRESANFTLGNNLLTEDIESDIEMTIESIEMTEEERAMMWVEQQIERRNNERI